MIAYSTAIDVLDAFRFACVGMGFVLLVISAFGAIHAFRYGWPVPIKIGLMILWVGRFTMVCFMSYFVIERLHHHLNWYTPIIFFCFVCMVVGNVMSRDRVAQFMTGKEVDQQRPADAISSSEVRTVHRQL